MSFLIVCAGLFMTAKNLALRRQPFLSGRDLKKPSMERMQSSNEEGQWWDMMG